MIDYMKWVFKFIDFSKSNESIGLGCEYCQFWLQKYFTYTYLLLSLLLSSVLRNTITQLKF